MADKDSGTLDPNLDINQIGVMIEGEPIPEDDPPKPEDHLLDHYQTHFALEGEEVPEKPFGSNCLEINYKKEQLIDKAMFNLMENIAADPLTTETEVDGLRVKRVGVRSIIDLDNYLAAKKSSLALGGIQYFYVKSNGYRS